MLIFIDENKYTRLGLILVYCPIQALVKLEFKT